MAVEGNAVEPAGVSRGLSLANVLHLLSKPHLDAQLPAGAGLAVDPVSQDRSVARDHPVSTVGLQADLSPTAAGLLCRGGCGLLTDRSCFCSLVNFS